MHRSSALLAAPDSSAFGDLLPWVGLLLGLVVIGAIAIALARRMLRQDGGAGGEGFTLHDLRELHKRGELSDEEFQRAKEAMIGRLAGRDADGESGPGETGDEDGR